MMAAPLPTDDPGVLVEELLAELGTLVRRRRAENLTGDEFEAAARSMRTKLQALQLLHPEPEAFELTEIGSAMGRLLDAGLLQPGAHIASPPGRRRGHLTLVADADLKPQGD